MNCTVMFCDKLYVVQHSVCVIDYKRMEKNAKQCVSVCQFSSARFNKFGEVKFLIGNSFYLLKFNLPVGLCF